MTFVLMQNTSLPKYRPLSSTPKAAYLPVTSREFDVRKYPKKLWE